MSIKRVLFGFIGAGQPLVTGKRANMERYNQEKYNAAAAKKRKLLKRKKPLRPRIDRPDLQLIRGMAKRKKLFWRFFKKRRLQLVPSPVGSEPAQSRRRFSQKGVRVKNG